MSNKKPVRQQTLEMNKLYKTLFFIGIVAGPIYWLMFTDDGKRRTDTMVLWLVGGQSVDLNFAVLDSHFAEDDWRSVYPELEWQCKPTESSFGERVCFTEIAAYNGIPSYYLSVFFAGPRTSAVKLAYRDQYHREVGSDLITQIGQPQSLQGETPVLQWQTDFGQVLLKRELSRGEEPSLLWLAAPPAD